MNEKRVIGDFQIDTSCLAQTAPEAVPLEPKLYLLPWQRPRLIFPRIYSV